MITARVRATAPSICRLLIIGTLGPAAIACSSEGGDDGASAAGAPGAGQAAGTTGAAAGLGGSGSSAGNSAAATAGATGAGSGGSRANAGSGGTSTAGTTGSAGAAGTSAGAGGSAGSAGQPTAGSSGSDCSLPGATAHFSFFVTSLAGLRRLSNNENGFGGDLRFGKADGLSGADEICRQLAESSSPGAGCKTWRAFLSVTKGPDGQPVHARDRIGDGPWYDRRERLVAMNKTDLLADWPVGAHSAIMFDLPNEDGVPNHDPDGTGQVDNHNTVTGTGPDGRLYDEDWAFTCHDWTSKVGTDGTPMIGFSWKGGAGAIPGSSWFSNTGGITEGGCAPIINLTFEMDFSIRGIGARGGYGGFYCLALEP